ncbi:MAG: hypothetical protein J6Z00_03330 [Clostridia bacterium]|nr:hypothetical protein [Clostridia bacterium]
MRKPLLCVMLIACLLLSLGSVAYADEPTSTPQVISSEGDTSKAGDTSEKTEVDLSAVISNEDSVYKPTSAFTSFTYDCWGDTVQCPDPYSLVRKVDGIAMGIGSIKKVIDIYTDSEGFVYLTTNGDEAKDNSIVKMDAQLNVKAHWLGFYDGGKFVPFTKPCGIFVTGEETNKGEIYVADSSTKDVYHLKAQKDNTLKLVNTIAAPARADSPIISDGFIERYIPSRVVVDHTNRVYVVATNVNEGIVTFNKEGKFDGFLAAGKVTIDAFTKFMKKYVYTDAQKKRTATSVPINYNNIDLDKEGFIFATLFTTDVSTVLSEIKHNDGTEAGALVRRLNMMGTDILKRDGYAPPVGDTDILNAMENPDATYNGLSQITDVSCGNYGTYALLDNNRNHIFVYNNEGYLLYAFSGPDITAGGMKTPIAIAQNDNYLYVLDNNSSAIFLYERTEFANAVIDAIRLEKAGKYSDASTIWKKVLDYDSTYDLAYLGLGKTAYWNGDYEESMRLFELCNNKTWYSKAWEETRKEVLARWFMPIVFTIIGLLVLSFVLKIMKKNKLKKQKEATELE